jgi:hypothetical protein
MVWFAAAQNCPRNPTQNSLPAVQDLPEHAYHIHVACLIQVQVHSQSHSTTDGQSVSMSWCRAQSRTFEQRFFFQCYILVFLRRPLWREVGSVIAVYSSQSLFTTNIYIKLKIYIVLHTFTIQYNIYNTYRPRSVQALYSRLCSTY